MTAGCKFRFRSQDGSIYWDDGRRCLGVQPGIQSWAYGGHKNCQGPLRLRSD
jgi:hypothetical protein